MFSYGTVRSTMAESESVGEDVHKGNDKLTWGYENMLMTSFI